jgi:aspartyl-tRNA(Asn)/glutamyl-tRNA(Gln) amidotransferase subunit A
MAAMNLQDLCLLPLHELGARIQKRSLSPVKLTDSYLARIERLDSRLHSYLTLTPDRARDDAQRAEREISWGYYRGPLHGIPIGLKDLFDTAGVPTTANSRVLRDRVPLQDATVVSRLRAAGAVLLGRLHMSEFAIGTLYLDDDVLPARNPWNLDHMPGGSSSGSGSALAAGLCAGALGSDTGGSVRNPAAHSGIVGLKPTYGLVSRQGLIPLSWTLDHVGPMARTVADVALLLQTIAGYDPADPTSARVPIPDYTVSLSGSARGIRIGVPMTFIESRPGLDPDVLEGFRNALKVLQELGAEVREVILPGAEYVEAVLVPILLSEAIAYHQTWLRTRRHEYRRGFLSRVLPGLFYTGADYVQAQRGRSLLCREVENLMATVDLTATPTVRETAPTFEEHAAYTSLVSGGFAGLFNVTGQPSISVPCGFDHDGLPIGLMLSGRPFDEVTVLRAADAYQRATEWHLRYPPLVA